MYITIRFTFILLLVLPVHYYSFLIFYFTTRFTCILLLFRQEMERVEEPAAAVWVIRLLQLPRQQHGRQR